MVCLVVVEGVVSFRQGGPAVCCWSSYKICGCGGERERTISYFICLFLFIDVMVC